MRRGTIRLASVLKDSQKIRHFERGSHREHGALNADALSGRQLFFAGCMRKMRHDFRESLTDSGWSGANATGYHPLGVRFKRFAENQAF